MEICFIEEIDRLFKVFNYPRVKLKEKEKARRDIKRELENMGYKVVIAEHKKRSELNIRGKNVNILTECENPNYIISAHYDTPRLIHTRGISYITRILSLKFNLFFQSICLSLIIFVIAYSLFKNLSLVIDLFGFKYNLILIFIFIILFVYPFKANLFNNSVYQADDNTSGIISVLLLAEILKQEGINNVQFVFFDNEEKGLCGSRGFLKHHVVKNPLYENTKVINLDTIGRGRNIYLKYDRKYVNKFFGKDKRFQIKDQLFNAFKFNIRINAKEFGKSFSDCKAFMEKGFEAISIIRADELNFWGKSIPDISWVHTYDDKLSNIDYSRMAEIISTIDYMFNSPT